MGNAPTKRVLRRMVQHHRPYLIDISEPFIQLNSIKLSFWRSLRLFPVAVNDRGDLQPNIWLLCDQAIQPSILLASAQQITISCTLDSVSCVITWVYAKTTIIERRQLWQDL
ncbi:hypothetical protein ACFX13_008873 [Malus domestica]